MMRRLANRYLVAALAGALAGCGGSNDSPTTPGPITGSPGPVGATITITAAGTLSPSSVTITVGQSVAFVNQQNTRRNIASDPHPTHTECPQINAVGLLNAGQARNTNAFPAARTCGFHDHDDPDNNNLKGQIVITP
jgi:plastocyanin